MASFSKVLRALSSLLPWDPWYVGVVQLVGVQRLLIVVKCQESTKGSEHYNTRGGVSGAGFSNVSAQWNCSGWWWCLLMMVVKRIKQ